MSMFDFEYAAKKGVRNNVIVREVDQARQRELWRSVVVGVALVSVLLFSSWQHFELLQYGYRIEQMQQERAEEERINRHLRLEIETLRSPRRIEQIAIDKLNLVEPTAEETVVIQRIMSAPVPDRLVVASRYGDSLVLADNAQ